MFKRQSLTRITLAVALLSAAVISLPAQAGGLLGSAGLGGGAGASGGLGQRSLAVDGLAAGRAEGSASRQGSPLRDGVGRGRGAADSVASEGATTARRNAEGGGAAQADAQASRSPGRVDASGSGEARVGAQR